MVVPWTMAEASMAALVIGGAAGGFVSHVVRTRVGRVSKKNGLPPDKGLDKNGAVVPVVVETEQSDRGDTSE